MSIKFQNQAFAPIKDNHWRVISKINGKQTVLNISDDEPLAMNIAMIMRYAQQVENKKEEL